MRSRLRSILRRFIRAPHHAAYVLLLLPFLAYQQFRLTRAMDHRRWPLVLKRARRIRRLGFDTDSLRYAVGLANTELEEWGPALGEFESIRSPLEDHDEEAVRYSCHAWALHNAGRTPEARALLQHALQPARPARRRRWAESFLDVEEFDAARGEELLH